jgi:hypothetical protein
LYTKSLIKAPAPALGAILLILFCTSVVRAHGAVHARVTILLAKSDRITVEAELSRPIRSFSFRNAYAGVLGIAERIEDFRTTDAVVQKAAVGEFRSDRDTHKISYTVKIPAPKLPDVSHVSWVSDYFAVLMLADLLPQDFTTVSIHFQLPLRWQIESSSTRVGEAQYEVVAPEKAVFIVARGLSKTSKTIDGMPLDLVTTGAWPFKDNSAFKIAGKVIERYAELTGFRLAGKKVIMIAPLPVAVGSTKWRAETRGSTVLLLIDPRANFANWIGQLGVIFTHELLHLWIPNSLRLDGDYDWFFEGFTLYTALRTALDLKLIDFKEFLDTLARVYDSYLSYADEHSLIEASERRWTTLGSFVYDKGMLVAFLFDLQLRAESKGATTLAEKYRELFSRPAADGVNGNDVIIAALGSSTPARGFTKSYIETSTKLELERLLPAYGLTLDSSGRSSQLRVSRELTGDQKRLLRSLGYRNK